MKEFVHKSVTMFLLFITSAVFQSLGSFVPRAGILDWVGGKLGENMIHVSCGL